MWVQTWREGMWVQTWRGGMWVQAWQWLRGALGAPAQPRPHTHTQPLIGVTASQRAVGSKQPLLLTLRRGGHRDRPRPQTGSDMGREWR